MNPKDQTPIRAIIPLKREIEEKQKEVSKRLGVIRDRERATGNKDALDVRGRRRDLTNETLS
jgi:hypothetical protein